MINQIQMNQQNQLQFQQLGKHTCILQYFLRFAFEEGRMVKNEKTEPISLSMNPPSKIRKGLQLLEL